MHANPTTQQSPPAIRLSRGGRGYQVKGLLHSVRSTMKPGNCNLCTKALPVPRHTATRVCDECKNDPVRLEQIRQKSNKAERDRVAAGRAPRAPVIRECQHRQQGKDGPICGLKFEAKPRIGKDGVNHGVSPEQVYCPEHQKPKAVARRRWLNRNVKNYRRLMRAYRHRNLPKVKKYQREYTKKIRALAAKARLHPDWDAEIAALRVQVEEGKAATSEMAAKVEKGKAAEAKLEKIEKGQQPVLVGPDRMVMNKPGPKPDVERALYICELYDSGLKWDAILERVQARFHLRTSAPSLREQRNRYLASREVAADATIKQVRRRVRKKDTN